jgi:predicted dinucleotide-binding enzyme
MNIGIIGCGGMGCALASKLTQAGHDVSMTNSRGPASIRQLTGELGAQAATLEEVTLHQQVIVVSIPEKNIPDLPPGLFAALPAGVVVIDTGNYYPTLRDGVIPGLDEIGIDSWWVQQRLGVPVVKVFNSIFAESLRELGRSKGDSDRIAMAVSGDDANAKELVFTLVDELGFDAFDIGRIADSWRQQPGSPIYCRDISLRELEKRLGTLGTDWSRRRDEILGQRKADEAIMAADYPAYLRGLRNQ